MWVYIFGLAPAKVYHYRYLCMYTILHLVISGPLIFVIVDFRKKNASVLQYIKLCVNE